MSILVRKIRAVAIFATTTARLPAAEASLGLLSGRMDILSEADPWAILFCEKGS